MMLSPLASSRSTRELASALHRYTPADVELRELPLAEVPIQPPYNDEPFPHAGAAWKEKFTELDGLLVMVRARTRSVPGHLKIGIDWASQPEHVNALKRLPCVVVAVGEGKRPSFLALQHARTVLSDAGANVMLRPDYSLVIVEDSFTPEGLVDDPELADGIVDILHSAAGFASHHRRAESLELPLSPVLGEAAAERAALPPGPIL
jgi:NAD(P)H-dependent FMN reductase